MVSFGPARHSFRRPKETTGDGLSQSLSLPSEQLRTTLYQERAVFGKMKMDPAKRAQTQNAGKVSSLQWFFFQSLELMTDKVRLHFIRPMILK